MQAYYRLLGLIIALLLTVNTFSATFKGKVLDKNSEPLIGSVVTIDETDEHYIAGMDGQFVIDRIAPGNYTAHITCLGYKEKELKINISEQDTELRIILDEDVLLLGSVSVSAKRIGNTEASARSSEKASYMTMNVMSAQAISLSTDLDVGAVIQRISGVSLEQSGSGSGTYSIIRGMPKRYNSTLVNGLKIPSPDNKHRYVPMDIFPSALVERVEVYKSLTPAMEADAIGGVVNMIMKSAPNKKLFNVDFSMGYHSLFLKNDFYTFDRSEMQNKSPFEINGPSYQAGFSDFNSTHMELKQRSFVPDFNANAVLGNRFLDGKFGAIVAVSATQEFKGSEQTRMLAESNRLGNGAPQLNNMQERYYSNEMFRFGSNLKLDYIIKPGHVIEWNNLFAIMNKYQVRDGVKTRIWGVEDPSNSNVKVYKTRFRSDKQQIFNSAFSGKHQYSDDQKLDWAVAYSFAKKQLPDQGVFARVANDSKGPATQLIAEDGDNKRQWEYNSDYDISAAINYSIGHSLGNGSLSHKVGALARYKMRNSFYVNYTMDPSPGVQAYGYDWEPDDANTVYTTWEHFDDVTWRLSSGTGSTTNEMNHDAGEQYMGGYYEFKTQFDRSEFLGGVRAEYVKMNYTLLAPRNNQEAEGNRDFFDVLPSLAYKFNINTKSNLKASYFMASTKPGFFEIIPYLMPDEDEPDYKTVGNPDLKRVVSQNFDLKYDYYPSSLDKVSVGVFYKHINDPIESVLYYDSITYDDMLLGNLNLGTATNYGVELEYIKYVRQFGVRLNYTFTESCITTSKLQRQREDPDDDTSDLIPTYPEQERPLQGQAQHIGNFSLLYKNIKKKWDSQISLVYTGERIKTVSGFYMMDEWESPYARLDFSIDKGIGDNMKVFFRAKNLLNTPYRVFIKYPVEEGKDDLPLQGEVGDNYIVREDIYGMSFKAGIKYKF